MRASVSLVWAVLMSVVVSGVPSGAQSDPDHPGPCTFDFLPEGHQRFVADGHHTLVVDFEVKGSIEGRFYYGLAYAFEDATFPDAPVREAGIAGRLIVDQDGALVDHAATRVFRAGLATFALGHEVEVAQTPGDACGFLASGGRPDLAPGSYRMIVPGATDHGSEIAAMLPEEVEVLGVRTLPVTHVESSRMGCAASTGAVTPGPRAQVLVGCRETITALEDEDAYWIWYTLPRETGDPLRQASWSTPDGDRIDLNRFLVGAGGTGTYRLDVPLWVAPVGHTASGFPFDLVPQDDGVAGVVAIVPAR